MKAVLYARVSSERQAEKDLSVASQLKALRKYASEHNYDIYKEFVDEAESARSANRPEFQKMIALARSKDRPFDIVLVWKLSRFARNREDSIVYKSLLRKKGIQVISITEKVEDSATGKLFEGIIEVMDEFYSENLSQEARRGLRECASRGFSPGGSTPVGYKPVPIQDGRAKRNKYDIDDDWAPLVKRIFRMCLDGHGTKDIANTLNREGLKTKRGVKWSKASVNYILKNDIYTGTFVWPKKIRLKPGEEQVVIKDNHPALISEPEFKKVQGFIRSRSPRVTHPRRIASEYILSGLLYCKSCGKTMQAGSAKSGKYHYYNCYTKSRLDNNACDNKAIGVNRIEKAVIDKLKSRVLTEENLTELLNLTNQALQKHSGQSENKLKVLSKQLADKERKIDRLYEVLEEGKLTPNDLAPRLRKLRDEVYELRLNIASIKESMIGKEIKLAITKPALKRYVKDLRSILSKGKLFEQKRFLQSFIKRIDYAYPQVIVHYTFPMNLSRNKRSEVLPIDKISGVDLPIDRTFRFSLS